MIFTVLIQYDVARIVAAPQVVSDFDTFTVGDGERWGDVGDWYILITRIEWGTGIFTYV